MFVAWVKYTINNIYVVPWILRNLCSDMLSLGICLQGNFAIPSGRFSSTFQNKEYTSFINLFLEL